jgi:hypothetical protein
MSSMGVLHYHIQVDSRRGRIPIGTDYADGQNRVLGLQGSEDVYRASKHIRWSPAEVQAYPPDYH